MSVFNIKNRQVYIPYKYLLFSYLSTYKLLNLI